jgi:hypothetical protein
MPAHADACTDLMVLEVPVLEDQTVDALHNFLIDLITQFENHYVHQLRRHWQALESLRRDPQKPGQPATFDPSGTDAPLDEGLNDDIPF